MRTLILGIKHYRNTNFRNIAAMIRFEYQCKNKSYTNFANTIKGQLKLTSSQFLQK